MRSKKKSSKKTTEPESNPLASLKEDALRPLLIRLFKAMGFQDICHHHGGALEKGKDITMWKLGELGERVNYAVVVKSGNISGSVTGKSGAGEVQTQIQQCFGSTFKDTVTSAECTIDRVWVIASGRISKEALHGITAALQTTNCLASTAFINGDKLKELVAQYLPGKTLLDQIKQVRATAAKVDDGYGISVGISETATTFAISAKNPAQDPPSLKITGKFSDDPAGEKTRKEFQKFLKSGGPLKLDRNHLIEIQLPEVLKKIFGEGAHHAYGFEFTPNPGPPVPVRFVATSTAGETTQLDFIELRCVRAGTVEIFLTNEHQTFPVEIRMLINDEDKRLTIQFESHCSGHNVAQVEQWLKFQDFLSRPGSFSIQHIDTGVTIAQQTTKVFLPSPNPGILEMAEALALIQRKTNALLTWPQILTVDDQDEIIRVSDILKTGREQVKSITVTIPAAALKSQPSGSIRTGHFHWFDDNDYRTLLGTRINLGRADIDCPASEIRIVDEQAEEADPSTLPSTERIGVLTAAKGHTLEKVFQKWPNATPNCLT